MRTRMLNNSIGMRIKENSGFGGTFYTWEISAWQGTIVQKKLATRSRGDSRFWAGGCVWFFVEFFFSLPGSTDTVDISESFFGPSSPYHTGQAASSQMLCMVYF